MQPEALVHQVVQAIAQTAPPGWEQLHGAFSFAGGQEIADVVATTRAGPVRIPIASNVLDPVRAHRMSTISAAGPWLRMLFDCDNTGALQVAFDYGDEPLPPEHLLPGEAYLSDFEQYPRSDAPVWLLAHMGNEGHQLRSAAKARRGGAGAAAPRVADDEIPPLPQLWTRVAALAAVCRATDALIGPRADPAFQVYSGTDGGCTLARLPGDRAVLSGGWQRSPLLAAAYKAAIGWPDLYRGAPPWLHSLYLDRRAARGLLSFCYWWDGGHWYRAPLAEATPLTQGDPPWSPVDEIVRGLPGVWTAKNTAKLVGDVLHGIGVQPSDKNAYAAIDLVRAAEARIVTERYLTRLFLDGVPATFDLAEALAQLDAADTLLPAHPPIDRATAIELAITFCRANGVGYPLERLVADRWDMGWQVFAPVPDGELAIGHATFLVADDGVVDQVASGPPSLLAFVFADRFAQRVRGGR